MLAGANGRWFDMWAVADLTNRLLMRQSEPSQPSIPLFTPTPAVWTAIQAVAEQVADISAFVERQSESFATGMDMCDFTMPADDLHPQYHYLRLRHELVKLPYNLLAVHLRNMELDVSNLMGWVLPASLSLVCVSLEYLQSSSYSDSQCKCCTDRADLALRISTYCSQVKPVNKSRWQQHLLIGH